MEASDAPIAIPPKTPILGLPISMTTYEDVLDFIAQRPTDRAATIAACNVHSVMTARKDPRLRSAIANASIATTDGVPLVWLLRLTCRPEQNRVYGPTLMQQALVYGVAHGWRHYLFGTTDQTLERLAGAIRVHAPEAEVVRTVAPPFRPLTPHEYDALVADVRASGADILWIGLGMPRQELLIDRIADRLPGLALAGVGAAFDLISGTVPQAPPWIQRAGLEWLYRLHKEPRRLWRRYIINNPMFGVLATLQVITYHVMRRREADRRSSER